MSGRIAIELKKTSVLLEVIGLHLSKRFHHCPHITKKGCWERSIWRSRCLEFGLTKRHMFRAVNVFKGWGPIISNVGCCSSSATKAQSMQPMIKEHEEQETYIYIHIRAIIDDEDGVGGSGSWFWFLGHDWWYQCQWWCHWCWWL